MRPIITAIAGALKNANGQVVPHAAMIEAVYGHRPDGGPLTARKCIQFGVCELRKQGWKIKSLKTIGWRLESAPCP